MNAVEHANILEAICPGIKDNAARPCVLYRTAGQAFASLVYLALCAYRGKHTHSAVNGQSIKLRPTAAFIFHAAPFLS